MPASVIASEGSSINTIARSTGVSPPRAGCVSPPAGGMIPITSVDYPTGFAAWGLGLQVHQDVVWQQPGLAQRLGVLTTGDVWLNTTFGYEAILPDDKPFRVCDILRAGQDETFENLW